VPRLSWIKHNSLAKQSGRGRRVSGFFVGRRRQIKHIGIQRLGLQQWLQSGNGIFRLMRAVLDDREVLTRMWVLRPQVLNRLKNGNSIFRPLQIDQAGTVLCQSYRLRTDHLLAGLEVPHGTSTVVLPVRKYAQHSVARGLLGSKFYDAV